MTVKKVTFAELSSVLVGVGLVLAGIVAGFLGSPVMTFFLGWIGFAMMLNASLIVRIGIGLVLGQFLMIPFLL